MLKIQVEDIKGILNEESEDELNFPSPDSSNNMSNMHGYIFAHSSKSVDMLALHPPAEHIPLYWEVFKERVDPLVKVLHIPTIEPTILESRHRLDQIHRGLEVLLFAVYYGAVTSLTNDQARQTFGEDKLELVMRYKFGCEQALARADFLQTDEMVVLQAFVTFLICLRRNDDARIIWTLTGLVVRMAQTLGIHRDGGHYDLAPFDIEMRRRLWWQICILDSRASEDHGCDPTITEQSFDTQMPLNVDDIDISPAMTSFPDPKLGCTEMTFGLIRFEIVAILRRIQYVPPGPKQCQQFFATVPLEKKEEWISECHARIEERYLKHCDMSVPLYWVIATVARLIMSKMWLMIYHPFQRQDGGNSLPQETKDKLFLTSLENIEYSLLLENEERTKKWGWLFQTYVQWHAIAFLLNELCIRTQGEYVERAWRAVEIVTNRRWGAEYANNRLKSHLWRPLRRLMNKAKAARTKELEKEAVQQTAAHGLPGLSREHAQNPGMELQFAAPYGLDINNLSGSASPQDFLAQPTGLTPIPTNFNISNMPSGIAKGTPQSTADSSSNAASGNGITATPPTANQSPNPNATFPRLGPLPTTTVAPMTTIASTDMSHGFGNMPDFNTFDWSQLNDPSLQISPTGTGQGDEIMAETVDWANWDDMVAQFGGIDQQSGNGENFVSGQMPGQMPGPGQPGGFGAGISSPNYWY